MLYEKLSVSSGNRHLYELLGRLEQLEQLAHNGTQVDIRSQGSSMPAIAHTHHSQIGNPSVERRQRQAPEEGSGSARRQRNQTTTSPGFVSAYHALVSNVNTRSQVVVNLARTHGHDNPVATVREPSRDAEVISSPRRTGAMRTIARHALVPNVNAPTNRTRSQAAVSSARTRGYQNPVATVPTEPTTHIEEEVEVSVPRRAAALRARSAIAGIYSRQRTRNAKTSDGK